MRPARRRRCMLRVAVCLGAAAEKHYRCPECGKKLATAKALAVSARALPRPCVCPPLPSNLTLLEPCSRLRTAPMPPALRPAPARRRSGRLWICHAASSQAALASRVRFCHHTPPAGPLPQRAQAPADRGAGGAGGAGGSRLGHLRHGGRAGGHEARGAAALQGGRSLRVAVPAASTRSGCVPHFVACGACSRSAGCPVKHSQWLLLLAAGGPEACSQRRCGGRARHGARHAWHAGDAAAAAAGAPGGLPAGARIPATHVSAPLFFHCRCRVPRRQSCAPFPAPHCCHPSTPPHAPGPCPTACRRTPA